MNKKIIIVKKTVRVILGQSKTSRPFWRNSQPQRRAPQSADGCGGIPLLAFLVMIFVGAHVSCRHEPPPRTPITYAPGAPVSNTLSAPATISVSSASTPLVISLWADHSASSINGGIPKLERSQLDPIINHLEKSAGALLVGKIGYHSRSDLAILYSKSALAFPEKRQGENSSMYMKRVDAYDAKIASTISSPTGIKPSDLQAFNKKVLPICDYSSYEGASDISSAVVVSNLFSEEDHLLENASKYIIILSDGFDFKSHDRFPNSLAKNTQLLLVTTLRKVGHLERYRHKKFTTLEGAVRYMLDQ